jgi:hypothetical protein
MTLKKLKINNWTNCIQDRKNKEILCWEGQNIQRIEVGAPKEEEDSGMKHRCQTDVKVRK